jgi:uncharacterized protein YjiS (DUF1127 family)
MFVRDANPYVVRTFGAAALHFIQLCLGKGARFAQICARALAASWREERTRSELLALSDDTLKDIGISRSEIWAKARRTSRSQPS